MYSLEIMLKRIPGVDYESAIERMSDDTAFYVELLRLFFNDNPSKKLVMLFEKGDYANAIYEAHSIKGTAANLGLVEIAQIAANIHLNLKRKDESQAKTMLQELEKACQLMSSIIDQLDGGLTDESAY